MTICAVAITKSANFTKKGLILKRKKRLHFELHFSFLSTLIFSCSLIGVKYLHSQVKKVR